MTRNQTRNRILRIAVAGALGASALAVLPVLPAGTASAAPGPLARPAVGTGETRLDPGSSAGVPGTATAFDPVTGRFFTVWTATRLVGSNAAIAPKQEILGSWVDASTGATDGPVVTIASMGDGADPTQDAVDPTIAYDSDAARFVIAYAGDIAPDASSATFDATDFRIFVRTFTPSTNAVSAAVQVTDTLPGGADARRPDLDVRGGFGRLVWEVSSSSGTEIRTSRVVAGAPTGSVVSLAAASPGPGSDYEPRVAVRADGRAMIAFIGDTAVTGGTAPRVLALLVDDADTLGTLITAAEDQNSPVYEEQDVDVAVVPSTGSFRVVWSANTVGAPDTFRVRGETLQMNGLDLSNISVVDAPATIGDQTGNDLSPAVAVNGTGQTVVAWVVRNGTDHQVWAARVTAAGVAQDTARLSTQRTVVPNVQPSRPAVSWSTGSVGSSSVAWGDASAWSRLLDGPAVDTTAPTAGLSAAAGPFNGAFTVTASFSEAVTGLEVADFGVVNGIASNLQTVSASEYTVTITPTTSGDVTISLPAGAASDQAMNPSLAATSITRVVDLVRPGVTLSTTANGPFNAAFRVTASFTEPVTGVTASDFTPTNATVSDLQGSGATWSVLVTPASQGQVQVAMDQNVASDAAGNGNTAATTITRTFDSVAPTPTLSAPTGPFNAPFTLTVSFSEAVTGLASTDFSVTNATVGTPTGSGDSYSVLVTPSGDGAVQVTLPPSAVLDAAGNGNVASNTITRQYDATAPTVTLDGGTGLVNGPFSVSITFPEVVTGFVTADVVVTNGTPSALTDLGGGLYTVTVTPAADGPVTVQVPAGAVTDAAGNDNTASNLVTRTEDGTRPTVTLAAPAGPVHAAFTVTGTFSEPVDGLAAGDLQLTGCTASDFTVDQERTEFAVLLSRGTDGDCSVSLPDGAATDDAGNTSTASTTLTRTFDLTAPGVALTAPASPVGASFDVTLTFDEAVTGLTLDDVQVTNGAASNLTGTGPYTVTITPAADGTIDVTVPAAAVQDAAGNPNAAASISRTADLTAPTVVLDAQPGPLNAAFDVTLTFSEAVTGLVAADLDVANGTASGLTGAGPYTVTITPTADGPVTVAVPAGSAADDAGNGNVLSATLTRTFDGTAPVLTITPAPGQGDPVRADEVRFLVEASEPVSDLEVAGIAIDGTSGATTRTVTRVDADSFTVAVTGMTTTGTVGISTVLGAVDDPATNPSAPASSPLVGWAVTRLPVIVPVFDQTCFDGRAEIVLDLRVDDGSALSFSSSDPRVLPPGRVALTRSGDALTLGVRPVAGQSGVSTVKVRATNTFGTSSLVVRVAVGTNGPDTIVDGPLTDIIFGRNGDDLLRGSTGLDLICGGGGDDRIRGGQGRDSLYGQAGDDTIIGNRRQDKVVGGPGRDTFVPGATARRLGQTRASLG